MREITYSNVSEWLIEQFPELEERYRSELEWWRDEPPGPHVVLGDIFVPYLRAKLRSNDGLALHNAFGFLEELAGSGGIRIREVVAFSVCEPVAGDPDAVETARYAGPITRGFMKEAQGPRRS